MPLTYDPVKGAPEVDLRQVQESAGEFASGLRVFTTAPGTTQTEKTQPILLISRKKKTDTKQDNFQITYTGRI